MLPGFGPKYLISPEWPIGLPVSSEDLLTVCKKIVRKLEYHYARRYIKPPYTLEICFMDETDQGAASPPSGAAERRIWAGH